MITISRMISINLQYDDVHGNDYEETVEWLSVPRVGELLGGLPGIDGEIPVTEVCYGLDGTVYVRAFMVDPEFEAPSRAVDRPGVPPKPPRSEVPQQSTIVIRLVIEGDPQEARDMVERALDMGALQVEIEENTADIGPLHVVDASIVAATGEPYEEDHSHG
jgi:hypothetical protein